MYSRRHLFRHDSYIVTFYKSLSKITCMHVVELNGFQDWQMIYLASHDRENNEQNLTTLFSPKFRRRPIGRILGIPNQRRSYVISIDFGVSRQISEITKIPWLVGYKLLFIRINSR